MNDRLLERVRDFLPTTRLGIDIGEWAGGIAVVRGNRILDAKTYTDYHGTTLEDRRKARRNRRTRHAKKMRLARLRSWALRQKLADGKRLPDPYDLMRRKEFQAKPGIYRVKGEALVADTWVESVKRGKRTDSEAFVLALTHIFQKRGFKWEGSDLKEMTDGELAEQLKTVRLVQESVPSIVAEIERRRRGPQQDYEGKIPDLERLLADACSRPRHLRVAEHRSIVEADLRAVVAVFAGKNAPSSVGRWSNELSRVLNKPVRPARFENRVLSGCSWCGKNTPRKSRKGICEKAYRGAVMNLRVEDVNARRPLTGEERAYFEQLWRNRPVGKPPSPETLKRKLLGMRCQPEMARQLYELLSAGEPKGRTNLCAQHLEMSAEGAFRCTTHRAICRGVGVKEHVVLEQIMEISPALRSARNPCREEHDKRVVRRIEGILFKPDGSPRLGEIPSLITIEFPKPHTARTSDCPGCGEKLAVDLRIRYRVKSLRVQATLPRHEAYRFECPACRCTLQVKGKRPFTVKGERRLQPVTLKNTDAFLRKAKGGLKDRKKRAYLSETKGKCVYCESALEIVTIRPDHVFPQSRGGPDVESNLVAACEHCNKELKGSKTPWEWKGHSDSDWWTALERRVHSLPMPLRKKQILLSKETVYPDNPTALARAGGRGRQFIEMLKEMLKKHEVAEDQIADNYEYGKTVIQTIDGWVTSRLRQSWLHQPDGTKNFPDKDPTDLRNHAQDATLIAACPPHTWRETIFVEGQYRDRAPLELAPDWSGYEASRRMPIVETLGEYAVRWRTGFANTKFWRDGSRGEAHPRQCVPIKDLKVKQATRVVDQGIRTELLRLLRVKGITIEKNESALPEEVVVELNKHLRSHIGKTRADDVRRGLQNRWPGLRHVQITTQIGGKPFVVRPRDGPPRTTEGRPRSEGAIVWLDANKSLESAESDDLHITLLHPRPFERFGVVSGILPPGATVLARWKRHDSVLLGASGAASAARRIAQKPAFAPGWYRFTEFKEEKLTVLPEFAIQTELAQRMGMEKGGGEERTLGKTELLAHFRSCSGGNVPPSTGSRGGE